MAAPGVDHGARLLVALDAIDRALHQGIEVLHPDRQAIEPEAREMLDARGIGLPRVDLDRVLALGGEVERGAQLRHQALAIGLGEEGRRAAAPMHLADFPVAIDRGCDEVYLAHQVVHVLRAPGAVLRCDLVARAVEAQRVAEGDVNV